MKNMTRGQAHQGDFSVGRGQIGNNKSCYGREQCCGVVVCWEVVWSGGIGFNSKTAPGCIEFCWPLVRAIQHCSYAGLQFASHWKYL